MLAHALIDALLGAAGQGDIGEHFPDTDPRYKDADSMVLLERSSSGWSRAGLELENVDCTVMLERPNSAPIGRPSGPASRGRSGCPRPA